MQQQQQQQPQQQPPQPQQQQQQQQLPQPQQQQQQQQQQPQPQPQPQQQLKQAAPQATHGPPDDSPITMLINQTIFAGNLECMSALQNNNGPRRYLAVLVAQRDELVGLFLFDPVDAQGGSVSFKLEEAIEAVAIDPFMDDYVSFALDDNSFSLISIDDSGEAHSFKFVCANASAALDWRNHLLPGGQPRNAAAGGSTAPTPLSVKGDASNPLVVQLQQELQIAQQQLAQSSDSFRSTSQKLSSMDLAYKCPPPPYSSTFSFGLPEMLDGDYHVDATLQGPQGTKPAAPGAEGLMESRHAAERAGAQVPRRSLRVRGCKHALGF